MESLRLKKNEDRRLRAGHLWIFSNEIDTTATPLKSLPPGELVRIEDHKGQPMGIAYAHPDTLISARLLTRKTNTGIGPHFFEQRLRTALALRKHLFDEPYYRLIHGESDGLPGLVVDRFGDVLAVQTNTAGMERLQAPLFTALNDVLAPRAIVLRNTSSLRQLEGLAEYTGVVAGELDGPVEIRENGARFSVDVDGGQKTGWFFDHRCNRALAARLGRGRRVLDLFAYSGAWGIQAAVAGAEEVDCIDSSEPALTLAQQNAALNGVGDRVHCEKADVFEFLKHAREERRRYGLIVVDPPALIKRKKDVPTGLEAYRRLNQAAFQLLEPGGILVSASCSHHLHRERLHDILRSVARAGDRHLSFVAQSGQAPDHPVHPAIPETEYLKAFFCTVTASL